jgi:hypothetical protein
MRLPDRVVCEICSEAEEAIEHRVWSIFNTLTRHRLYIIFAYSISTLIECIYVTIIWNSRSREISYMKYENGRLPGLVTSYSETAF